MQYSILVIVITILFIFVLGINLRAWHRRTRFNEQRKNIAIQDTQKLYFSSIENNKIREIWFEISRLLKIDQNKLKPDDSLKDFIVFFAYEELYLEDLEELFLKYNRAENNLRLYVKQKTIKDLVTDLA